jgi:hypothetical protein
MKMTNEKMVKIILFGFLGLIAMLIIGASTIVLMPLAVIYMIIYLGTFIYLSLWYLINKSDEAKQSFKDLVEYCSDPQVVHESSVKRGKKAAAKRRRKQIKRSKKQARRLVIARAVNQSIKELLK